MKISGAKSKAIIPQWLFESNVVTLALFRFQVWVRKKIEGRKTDEELGQARRFKAGAVTCLELRAYLGNQVGRGDSPGCLAAEALVLIVANARSSKKIVHDL